MRVRGKANARVRSGVGSNTKRSKKTRRASRVSRAPVPRKPKPKRPAVRKPARRKLAPRKAKRPVRKQASRKPTRRRLEQEIKRLRSELREATRQPPSKPPRRRRVVTQEEIDEGIPFAPERPTIPREYAPVSQGEEFEDIAAEFYDLVDYDWDDFYDEVGDEDEDSYGEDGG